MFYTFTFHKDQHAGALAATASASRACNNSSNRVASMQAFRDCRTILKLFVQDHKEYQGTVQAVDTELETGTGEVERGLFFRIL